MPVLPLIGPNQPFRLDSTAVDPDNAPLALQYLWVQVSGPDVASFDSMMILSPTITCPVVGTYVFELNATDGIANVQDSIAVVISNIFSAAASYTATCAYGFYGTPVTKVFSYSSTISLADAQAQAAAGAQAAAQAALFCTQNLGPLIAFSGTTPTVAATATYTIACPAPYSPNPVTKTVTYSTIGVDYPTVESTALAKATVAANNALNCTQANLPPTMKVTDFSYTVFATSTYTGTCIELGTTNRGPAVTLSARVTLTNTPFFVVQQQADALARARALAAVTCVGNLGPIITFNGISSTVSATITYTSVCPFPQRGSPSTVTNTSVSTFSYADAESSAAIAAIAATSVGLVCVPNLPPSALIIADSALNYDANVPYRSDFSYNNVETHSTNYAYTATATASVSCPAGTYGQGAYAYATGMSFVSFNDAYNIALANATIKANALLTCTNNGNRILFNYTNYPFGFVPGAVTGLGIFRLTTGTVSVPTRTKFLNFIPLPTSFDPVYWNNTIYLDPFFDRISGNHTYILRFGRLRADGSYIFQPDSVSLRIDKIVSTNATISSIAANPSAGILSATNGAISFTGQELLQELRLSIATAPYLALDAAGWRELADTYVGLNMVQVDTVNRLIYANSLGAGNGLALIPDPRSLTETNLYPLPYTPSVNSLNPVFSFAFYFRRSDGSFVNFPLSAKGSPAPEAIAYSSVALTNNVPPFTVSSVSASTVYTIVGGASAGTTMSLPAGSSNLITFANIGEIKTIVRRFRENFPF